MLGDDLANRRLRVSASTFSKTSFGTLASFCHPLG